MLRFTTVHTGSPYYTTTYSGGATQADADGGAEVITDFWDSLSGYITTGLSSQVQSEVEEVNPATGLVTNTFSTNHVPALSTGNAPLPPSVQGLIRLRTTTFLNGRRVLGHIYVPSLANDAQLVGEPDNAFVAALTAAGNALIAGLNLWGGALVYSRTHLTAAPATTAGAWNRFAVLRSRRD